MLPTKPAERHRAVAARFADLVANTRDWDAPAPVAGWTALSVLEHLLDWLPGLLAGSGGPILTPGPAPAQDPIGAWRRRSEHLQQLLDDPATAAILLDNPHLGRLDLASALDRFYVSDVFLHSWDLARATGQDDRLDTDTCQSMYEGMAPMQPMLQASGQYGPQVPVPDDASVQDRLLGLIGRDPDWGAAAAPAVGVD